MSSIRYQVVSIKYQVSRFLMLILKKAGYLILLTT